MNKIIILVGISNSGKSTFANQEWEKNPTKTVVVNRDKIRELISGYDEANAYRWYNNPAKGALEKDVTMYEDTLIHEALCKGKDVIVDATHLTASYIKRYEFWNKPIEVKFFHTSLEDALSRNALRNRKVDVDVIRRQYDSYVKLKAEGIPTFEVATFKNDRNLPPCIIYDIDGTIAKMHNRGPFDWHRVGEDLVIPEVTATLDWVNDLDRFHKPTVIIVSGRDAKCMYETSDWLHDNGLEYDELFLRKEGDQRADWVIKEEIWREIAKEYYIVGMYDDRNQVTRRARSLGLKVFQVEYGNF